MSNNQNPNQKIHWHVLTLFPEAFTSFLGASLIAKALEKGLLKVSTTQIRDFAKDKHHTVDEPPFGGGEGMVLKVDVLFNCFTRVREGILRENPDARIRTLLMSPQGQLFSQPQARVLLGFTDLILVCGHYEGVDERFIELCVEEELSIGDYVLTGGELPAAVIMETVSRLIPGVVGNPGSLTQESFEDGFLKYPQYTRPREFQGKTVPEILLSGDHQGIALWRRNESLKRTQVKRPDLIKK